MIAVVDKRIELAEKIILSFPFAAIEIDNRISLEVFGGFACRGFLNIYPYLVDPQPLFLT